MNNLEWCIDCELVLVDAEVDYGMAGEPQCTECRDALGILYAGLSDGSFQAVNS